MDKESTNSTTKPKGKGKGFASNPHLINREGRPKGSRNKASMKQARDYMDANASLAARYLVALMTNDKEFLDTTVDVAPAVRLKATESLMNKSIANEKDNRELDEEEKKASSKKQALSDDDGSDDDEEDTDPIFSMEAVIQ